MDLDILLPFHRADRFLSEAIQSINLVEKLNPRVILIDDRIDKSDQLLPLFRTLKNFEIVTTQGGRGYGQALKVGSQLISSDVVALFNSDDVVHPLRFSKQIAELDNFELCLTKMERLTRNNRKAVALTGSIKSDAYDPIYLLLGSYGADATWCMRSEWWIKNSFFDGEECLDWRIALHSFKNSSIKYLNETLYFYRKHALQVTATRVNNFQAMIPVYESWEVFARYLGVTALSYDVFSILGTPWSRNSSIDLPKMLKAIEQISDVAKRLDSRVAQNVSHLIQRRCIFALRHHSTIFEKLKLIQVGSPQIFEIGKDIMMQALR